MHLKSSCFAILNLNIAFFCHSHCHPWIIVAYKAPYCKMHIELSRAGTFLYIKKMNCVNMDNTK